MNPIETNSMLEALKEFYPDWVCSEAEAGLWTDQFKYYSVTAVNNAIRQYKVSKSGRYKMPKIYDVIGLVKTIESRLNPTDGGVNEIALAFILRCADPGEGMPPYYREGHELKYYCYSREADVRQLRNAEIHKRKVEGKDDDDNLGNGSEWDIIRSWEGSE